VLGFGLRLEGGEQEKDQRYTVPDRK